MRLGGCGNGGFRRGCIGNVAGNSDTTDLGSDVSASLALMSQTATFAPPLASLRAVAAPSPDAPPVTSAAWSFNCMVLS